MSAYDVTSSLHYDDAMTSRASYEAEERYRVRGEVMWTRKEAGFELPSDRAVVRSTKYETAAFRDDGEIFRVNAFVVTGFATVVLIRMVDTAVRLTIWGDNRGAVGETVKAFLAVWPPEGTGSTSELMAGQYV